MNTIMSGKLVWKVTLTPVKEMGWLNRKGVGTKEGECQVLAHI